MIKHKHSASKINIQHFGHIFINYLIGVEKWTCPYRTKFLCESKKLVDIKTVFIWSYTKEKDLFWQEIDRFHCIEGLSANFKWQLFKIISSYKNKSGLLRFSKYMNYD